MLPPKCQAAGYALFLCHYRMAVASTAVGGVPMLKNNFAARVAELWEEAGRLRSIREPEKEIGGTVICCP